jgi:signal transduction histidine kinase
MTNTSIYSLIHNNLKRMLLVTLGVSAVLLFIYTVFSFKQTEGQASRFIVNHIERLAQTGIFSQNEGDVDLEVARFAQTWKETQDIDLRIDIYLNGRQISHAGQLQPFKRLNTQTEKLLSLPSGDKLRIVIQMDLTEFIFYGVLLLLALELAVVGLFYILNRSMQNSIHAITKPLESKVAWIKEIARDLPNSARANTTFKPSRISEIDDLGESIRSLTEQIVGLEDNLARVNFDRGRVKMAEKVAHAIKGVIATLQLKASKFPKELEKERNDILDCIATLSDISGNLLKSKKISAADRSQGASDESAQSLSAIRSAVTAKQEQYRDNSGVSISLAVEHRAATCLTSVGAPDLQTILFNLIDNSVEALKSDGGRVDVKLEVVDGALEIAVSDNGKGVPKHVLPSLMTEGFTYDKEGGTGVGLFHTKELAQAAGGSVEISSEVGQGTVVRVRVPALSAPAQSNAPTISLNPGSTVVCVDDDPTIHLAWDARLRELKERLKEIVHLRSVADFENWISENGHGVFESRLYLFDFDLKDQNKTGLDLISEHGIALESILVSGMVDDPGVKERTDRMGLRRFSKDHLSTVAIHVEQSV